MPRQRGQPIVSAFLDSNQQCGQPVEILRRKGGDASVAQPQRVGDGSEMVGTCTGRRIKARSGRAPQPCGRCGLLRMGRRATVVQQQEPATAGPTCAGMQPPATTSGTVARRTRPDLPLDRHGCRKALWRWLLPDAGALLAGPFDLAAAPMTASGSKAPDGSPPAAGFDATGTGSRRASCRKHRRQDAPVERACKIMVITPCSVSESGMDVRPMLPTAIGMLFRRRRSIPIGERRRTVAGFRSHDYSRFAQRMRRDTPRSPF